MGGSISTTLLGGLRIHSSSPGLRGLLPWALLRERPCRGDQWRSGGLRDLGSKRQQLLAALPKSSWAAVRRFVRPKAYELVK